jgi:hypothetical protein
MAEAKFLSCFAKCSTEMHGTSLGQVGRIFVTAWDVDASSERLMLPTSYRESTPCLTNEKQGRSMPETILMHNLLRLLADEYATVIVIRNELLAHGSILSYVGEVNAYW